MVGFILGFIVVIFGLTAFFTFKPLAKSRNTLDSRWHEVNLEFEKRRELIGVFLEMLRKADELTAAKMTEALRPRRVAAASNALAEVKAHEEEVSRALRNLLTIMAQYPEVEKLEDFHTAVTRLFEVEDRIEAARRHFNDSVSKYNAIRIKFPISVYTNILDYQPEDRFDVQYATEGRTAGKTPCAR
jgi:LemA protein